MSVRLSLLAILAQRPSYGYQLKAEFERRTGNAWPLNVGQVYNTVDRLERAKLLERVPTHERPDDAPGDQQYHRVTAAGAALVRDWFATPQPRAGTGRDELAMKIAVAATLPGMAVAELISRQREAALAQRDRARAAVADDPEDAASLAARIVGDAEVTAAQAELDWLDRVEARLVQAAADGIPTELPLAAAPPRRGRPAKAPRP